MADGAGYGVSGSPCGLEIEATRYAVDVEHLADEIEAGTRAALQGRGADCRERNTAAGDKLVAVGRTAAAAVFIGDEHIYQSALFLRVQTAPRRVGALTDGFFAQICP